MQRQWINRLVSKTLKITSSRFTTSTRTCPCFYSSSTTTTSTDECSHTTTSNRNDEQQQVLVRDFIYDSLYSPIYGYFNSQDPIIFTSSSSHNALEPIIDFKSLEDHRDYYDQLHHLYTTSGHSWGTPAEIFQPYFAQSILNYILMKYDQTKPLIIYEIGGGTGTCALNVLDTLAKHFPAIYRECQYNIVEVSSELHQIQQKKLQSHEKQVNCYLKSVFEIREIIPVREDNVFIIALEVMDNLPHDKIVISGDGSIYQTVVVEKGINDRGVPVFEELEVPLTDPLIYKYLKYTRSDIDDCAPAVDETKFVDLRPKKVLQSWFNKSTSNFREYIVSLTGVGDQVYYIPTMQMQMIEILCSVFPNHEMILADFDYLPRHDLVMYTENAIHNPPIVQRKFQKKTKSRVYNNSGSNEFFSSSFSTYLVPKGTCDIFFATDFKELQKVYAQCRSNPTQSSTVMKMSQFVERFATDISATQTKSGYNPVLKDYSNFAFFTSDNFPVKL